MQVVFYDGYCPLCVNSVKFIIKRDKKERFYFSSLDSEFSKQTIPTERLGYPPRQLYYLRRGKLFYASSAALYILKDLGGGLCMVVVFFVFPKFFRDFIYFTLAKYRYKWFGKLKSCWVPNSNITHRIVT